MDLPTILFITLIVFCFLVIGYSVYLANEALNFKQETQKIQKETQKSVDGISCSLREIDASINKLTETISNKGR